MVLKHSRIFVCWIAIGIILGAYDNAIKYVTSRKQFGKPVAGTFPNNIGFQMVQEKIVKMMAGVQGCLLLGFHVSKLADEGKLTIGQIAMTKAYITDRGRDITRWGREIMGGNGIIHENHLIRAMADMEAIYTYEGTYDINTLVAGREITGIAAFRNNTRKDK